MGVLCRPSGHSGAHGAAGGKIFVSLQHSEVRFSQGDIIHLHQLTFISRGDDAVYVRAGTKSVVRLSRSNQHRCAIELCGGAGSMLDCFSLLGYRPLVSVELNRLAMKWSSLRHPVYPLGC